MMTTNNTTCTCHQPLVTLNNNIYECPCTICLVKVTCGEDDGCDDYQVYHKVVEQVMINEAKCKQGDENATK